MKYKKEKIVIGLTIAIAVFVQCSKTSDNANAGLQTIEELQSIRSEKNKSLVAEGKEIFRFDRFGDEVFWSGLLHLDKAIAGMNNGGFGPGVSPATALSVGLKVDSEALPADVVAGITSGAISLNDP